MTNRFRFCVSNHSDSENVELFSKPPQVFENPACWMGKRGEGILSVAPPGGAEWTVDSPPPPPRPH